MAVLKNTSFTNFYNSGNAQEITSSRTKLYGMQYIVLDDDNANASSLTVAGVTMSFTNGESGSVLFKFTPQLCASVYYTGINPQRFMFGHRYILFPDGIWASSVGAGTASATEVDGTLITASFFYEEG